MHNLLCHLTGPFTNIYQHCHTQAYEDGGERALYPLYLHVLCTDISAIDNGYLCGSLGDGTQARGESIFDSSRYQYFWLIWSMTQFMCVPSCMISVSLLQYAEDIETYIYILTILSRLMSVGCSTLSSLNMQLNLCIPCRSYSGVFQDVSSCPVAILSL